MRSIIRFSINGEANGVLRNALAKILTDAGYQKHQNRTATYEHAAISEKRLARVMQEFWKKASDPPQNVAVDHVWTYADNPPKDVPTSFDAETDS